MTRVYLRMGNYKIHVETRLDYVLKNDIVFGQQYT